MSSIIKSYNHNFISNVDAPYKLKQPTEKIHYESDNSEKNYGQSLEPAILTIQEQEILCKKLIDDAHNSARKIMDNAKSFSVNHMRETTERATEDYNHAMDSARKEGFENGVEQGRVEGRKIGYNEGFEQGEKEAEEIYKQTISFMHGVIEGIDDGKENLLKKYHDDLKDVAFAMAEKILKKEVNKSEYDIKLIIENAAQMCKNEDYLRVILSKNSYGLLSGDEELESRLNSFSDDIKFVIDYDMLDSDCIIETPIGMIDASVSTQLENMKTSVKEMNNDD